jgi:hypothetical protein
MSWLPHWLTSRRTAFASPAAAESFRVEEAFSIG